jgi:hypothetical protein
MKFNHTLFATTNAVALVAGINFGLAQSSGSGGGMGGGAGQAQPGQSQGVQQRGQGTDRMERQGQGTEQRGGETRGQAQGQQRERDPMTGQGQSGQRDMQREGQRDGQRDRTRAGQDREGARERGAEQRKDGARDRQTTQERRGGSAGETTGSAPARVTNEQRTRIVQHREVLSRHRIDRSQINVDIRVGATVPRTVTFYELPPQIIEVVPAWRTYRYVMVDDEIVIIDPGSYRIVAVIDA